MDAAKLWRLMECIPDRASRAPAGLTFAPVAAGCADPERLALLAEFLHWLAPLYPSTREDQARLGLFAHKPAPAEDEDDETAALEEETLV